VAGIVDLSVRVLKDLEVDGPILLPVEEDLPVVAKPYSKEEREKAEKLAEHWGVEKLEESFPLSFVGTDARWYDATDNRLEHAAKHVGIEVPEVMNRLSITGSIDISRDPGVVTVTFLVPSDMLRRISLDQLTRNHYS